LLVMPERSPFRLLLLLPRSSWKLQVNSCMVVQLSVFQPRW